MGALGDGTEGAGVALSWVCVPVDGFLNASTCTEGGRLVLGLRERKTSLFLS